MPCAERVDNQPCPGQMLQQLAGAARVVEMNVREDDPLYGLWLEPLRREGCEQPGNRPVGAGVHEGGSTVLHDEVACIEARTLKAGIDEGDAVRQPLKCRHEKEPGSRWKVFARLPVLYGH